MKFASALSNNDAAGSNGFTAEPLYAKSLGDGVAPISG